MYRQHLTATVPIRSAVALRLYLATYLRADQVKEEVKEIYEVFSGRIDNLLVVSRKARAALRARTACTPHAR